MNSLSKLPLGSREAGVRSQAEDLGDARVARGEPDDERHRRAPGDAVVLLQVDGHAGDGLDLERPQHVHEPEEYLLLRQDDTGADAPPVEGGGHRASDARRNGVARIRKRVQVGQGPGSAKGRRGHS